MASGRSYSGIQTISESLWLILLFSKNEKKEFRGFMILGKIKDFFSKQEKEKPVVQISSEPQKRNGVEYCIPLEHKSGEYRLNELQNATGNLLILKLATSGILSYQVPESDTEIRLYDITGQMIKEGLVASYEEGHLKRVDLKQDDRELFVYIYLEDDNAAKEALLDFAGKNAEMISNEIIKCREEVARLFIEYFYDGQAFDFAAKIATVEDKQAVIQRCIEAGEENNIDDWADNSGNYPEESRIECDNDNMGIMLSCVPPHINDEMYDMVVEEMTNYIRNAVVDKICRSSDFKFIAEEYD